MRYLSDEWMRAQWDAFEAERIGRDTSNCGGLASYDGPCGGCARCLRDQFSYYLRIEEAHARVFLAAGFDVLDPCVVTIPWTGHVAMPYHTAWDCNRAGERGEREFFFPWEKR